MPSIVDVSGLTLRYPIRVEIGIQRVPVMTCWAWLRAIKEDSFLFAMLSGRSGWQDQRQFLDTITEENPVPVLRLMTARDAFEDRECVHLRLLFSLVHAQALDDDPLVSPEEVKRDPEYKSRTTLVAESMTVDELIQVVALADQYGI